MLGAANRGSLLSGYVGGSQTARYRQVDIGKGSRYDFTTANVNDKSESKYEFEKFGSIQYQVSCNKERGTRKSDTFGNTYDKYEKAVVNTGLNHYLGKGNQNHNGLGAKELQMIESHTKFTVPRLAFLTSDRGLLSPTSKQIKASAVGPGTYTDNTKDAFLDKSFRVKKGSFGTANRDAHFSKYSSVHSELVSRGLN